MSASLLLSSTLLLGSHLVIVIDDIGSTNVGAYSEGLPEGLKVAKTPRIDSLADSGVRFDRAYVNPLCGPTRAALFTGRYAFRTGIGANVFNNLPGGPTDAETWLAEAMGPTHATALFGKWHLAAADNGMLASPLDPALGGVAHFDEHLGTYANIVGPTEDYFNWYLIDNGIPTARGNPDGALTRDARDYNTTVTVDLALDWIEAQTDDWLCVVSFAAGHEPLHRPPTKRELAEVGRPPLLSAETEKLMTAFQTGNQGMIAKLGWADVDALEVVGLAAFNAMVEAMDTEIGRLIDESNVDLDPVSGDTTVWILGDNGPDFRVVEMDKLEISHAKATQYELAVRAPFIVAGRGVTEMGRVSERLVQHVDVYSTILAMESIPSTAVDGVDISPYFADVAAPAVREFAYTELFAPVGPITDPADPGKMGWNRSIQDEDWKLITRYVQGATPAWSHELYFVGGAPAERQVVVSGVPLGLVPKVWNANPDPVFEEHDFLQPRSVPPARSEPMKALRRLLELEAELLDS